MNTRVHVNSESNPRTAIANQGNQIMKNIVASVLIMTAYAAFPSTAHAVQIVTCGNCAQDWQYESAGEIAHGDRRGWDRYMVLNPNTAKALYVTVNYVPPGEVPRRIERAHLPAGFVDIKDIEVPTWRLPSRSISTPYGQGDYDSSSHEPAMANASS